MTQIRTFLKSFGTVIFCAGAPLAVGAAFVLPLAMG